LVDDRSQFHLHPVMIRQQQTLQLDDLGRHRLRTLFVELVKSSRKTRSLLRRSVAASSRTAPAAGVSVEAKSIYIAFDLALPAGNCQGACNRSARAIGCPPSQVPTRPCGPTGLPARPQAAGERPARQKHPASGRLPAGDGLTG
jgi:hypothetical protein